MELVNPVELVGQVELLGPVMLIGLVELVGLAESVDLVELIAENYQKHIYIFCSIYLVVMNLPRIARKVSLFLCRVLVIDINVN